MTDQTKPARNFPFDEVAAACRAVTSQGGFVIQKWTCAGCSRRLSANRVNHFVETGHCDHCQHNTDLKVAGCNFAKIQPLNAAAAKLTATDIELMLGLSDAPIQ